MEKQMTLPRIRRNNEKIIFRIGTPMLANPTSAIAGSGRPNNGWAGQLEAMKTTFITTRLRLTPQEAEKFWPIYNLYAAEVKQANYNFRHIAKCE